MTDAQTKMETIVAETSPGKRKLEEPASASPTKKLLKSIEKEETEQVPKEVVANGVEDEVKAKDVEKNDDGKAETNTNGGDDNTKLEATSTDEPAKAEAEVEKAEDDADGESVAVEEEEDVADGVSAAEKKEEEGSSAKPVATNEVKGDAIVSAAEPEPEVTA
ncbi:unnamed protein product [Orchesella dallaii]|uniref:Uncharacterized protein n=1 Tax=Orchesella dallaii TaxID=48710 RepID=A0ABP1QKE6_9HEXA